MRYSIVKPSKAVILAREPAVSAQGDAAAFRVGDWEAPAPALLPVANRPLLGHALDWLGAAGMREVAIVTGDRVADEARDTLDGDWPFKPDWLIQKPGERLGDSLAALTGFLDGEPAVLHLADSLARQSLPALLGAGGG